MEKKRKRTYRYYGAIASRIGYSFGRGIANLIEQRDKKNRE